MPVNFSIADSSDGPRKVVIWVTGELDADTSHAVRARLAQAQRHARSDVILDMTGVTFVDSFALTAIVNGARALGDDRPLRVISPPDRVAKIFTDAGLADLVEFVEDRRAQVKVDRRKRDVPVAVDRRSGGDRRFLGKPDDEQDPAADSATDPVKNSL
jgi:anti-anti-sigma factor